MTTVYFPQASRSPTLRSDFELEPPPWLPTYNPQPRKTPEREQEQEQCRASIEERVLARLPRWISLFLGHRSERSRAPLRFLVDRLDPTAERWLWLWVGTFVGIGCVALLMSRAGPFRRASDAAPLSSWASPTVVGSLGASAVLLYGEPQSPLSQPYNFFAGQTASALVAVGVTKLFALSSKFDLRLTDNADSIVWVNAACATACALLGMYLINAVHPPGGSTALLAATSPDIVSLGWRLVPELMLSMVIMLLWALLWMNLGRQRYPHFFNPGLGTGTGPEAALRIFKWTKARRGMRG